MMQTYAENIKRFWERVWFDDGCWPWCGPRNMRGYGQWKFRGKTRRATRIMWEIFKGPIPDGLSVLHECDNPCCVNIGHLFLGTQTDNMRDCAEKGRNYVPLLTGEEHGGSKLTEEQVREIVSLENVHSHGLLAKMFNISRSVVTRIFQGILWGHVTGRVRFDIPKLGRRLGTNHHSAKLTEENVRDIRRRLAFGESQYSLSKIYKVNRRSMWELAHRKTWAHVQ
jgi:hypothetical protein